MLINLLPDFFAVLNSTDRVAAYQRYFEVHRRILDAYPRARIALNLLLQYNSTGAEKWNRSAPYPAFTH